MYVSALLQPKSIPAQTLKLWRQQRFELLTSLCEEISRVLHYPRIRKLGGITERRALALLYSLYKKAV